MLIGELLEAEIDTNREEEDEHVEIEEEGWPGGRLMLRDGSDDGDVNLGVSCIPERVEATAPGGNDSSAGGNDKSCQTDGEDTSSKDPEETLELTAGDSRFNVIQESKELEKAKDAESGHVLASLNGEEPDEWNLHASKSSQGIPGSVCHI